MADLPNLEHQYPLVEFLEDFASANEGGEQERVLYFLNRYPDFYVRGWRMSRLAAAVAYLAKHEADLNRSSPAAGENTGGALTARILSAAWVHWTQLGIDPKAYDPPVEEFLRTCQLFLGTLG